VNLSRTCLFASTVLTCTLALHSGAAEPGNLKESLQKIPAFQLRDTTGQSVSLSDFRQKKAVVVVFIGTECPLVNLYVLRLAEIQREYAPRGVQILAINSNSQDSPQDVIRHAQERKLPFPILIDPGQEVADLFGARRTPETFLLDEAGVVRYHGRIDDRYSVGGDRGAPRRHDLVEAIREVLANRPVSVPTTPVAGCFIPRQEPARGAETITYTRHVAPILQKNCQECHRPGQVAPFSLLTYQQARAWSATIREVVLDNRMPPWHADPLHGKFANDRSLSQADRTVLLAWIKQGCVKGDDADAPAPQKFSDDWGIGKPDMVLSMKEAFTIPAEAPKGGVPYQKFVLATNFERDVWVQAVEARPGNRAVVHHMVLYIGDPPNRAEIETSDRDVLAGYVPGSKPIIFPSKWGKRIPRGARLVLEMHYTANGTEQTDLSSVGLIFAKDPPQDEIHSRFVLNSSFIIPAGAADHEVTAVTTFDKDALILSLTPHMHLRGKSFLFRAVYPDQRTEILLSVPRYDFNWQHRYVLHTPLHVPAGTRIECVGRFDNSASNPNNPDPTHEVRHGDQSWEEMMLGVIGYINADGDVARPGAGK
jgi:peroxiredoxin